MRLAGFLLVTAIAGLAAGGNEPDVGRVRVHVTDAAGKPVESPYADVVTARRRPGDGLWERAAPDPDSQPGDAIVAEARSGPARVVAYATGHGLGVSPWFDVKAGSVVDIGVRLQPPSWTVHGEVADPDGELVQDARVTITPESEVDPELWALLRRAGHFRETKTHVWNGHGGFDYQWLPPGTYRFDVHRPNRSDSTPLLSARATVPPTGNGTIPVKFVLPREATPRKVDVRVRAVDAEGAPIAAFRGAVMNDQFGYSFEAHGGAAVGEGWGVPPLELHVSAAGFREAVVDVVQRDEPYEVRLERLDPRLRIAGTVTCNGKPVEWQRVRQHYGTNRGAALDMDVTPLDGDPADSLRVVGSLRGNGSFEFTPPRAGRWRLRASGEGPWQPDGVHVPLPAEVVVEAGTRGVEVVMRPGAPLVVALVPPDGAVIGDTVAHLVDETGPMSERRRTVFTAEGSTLTFPSLFPEHSYTLIVAAKCGASWTDVARVQHLVPGQGVKSVPVRSGRTVLVHGARTDGSPVVGADVRRADVSCDFDWVTGLDGTVRVTLPATGDATVSAAALGLTSGAEPFTVAADASEVTVVVTPLPYSQIQ